MPIYFRSYGVPSDADLNLQQIVHTSLDIIEEESKSKKQHNLIFAITTFEML